MAWYSQGDDIKWHYRAIGFVIVREEPSAWCAFAGFVVVGLGAANLIPLLFTIASRQKKMPVPQAISSVTTLGYLGLLVGPAMMGFIAHATSLYVVFGHCRGTHDFRQCHVALAA